MTIRTASESNEEPVFAPVDEEEILSIPAPRIGGWVGSVLNGLSGLCMFLASVCLVVLLVIFGWLVFGRYVLNNTPTWVEQMALLLVIAITFLGSATLVHEDRHLGVTFLRDALPNRWRLSVRLVGDLTLLVFGVFMAVYCTRLVEFSWGNKLPMLGLPEGLRSVPAMICGGLIVLFAAARALAVVRELASGAPDAVDPVPSTREAE